MKIPAWLFVCPAVKIFRSSRKRCFIKNGVLKNFAKFTGKHCARVSFATLLKKVFSWKFCKIFKNTFLTEHPWTTASEYYGIKNNNSVNSHLFKYFFKFIISENSSWPRIVAMSVAKKIFTKPPGENTTLTVENTYSILIISWPEANRQLLSQSAPSWTLKQS